MVNSKKDLWYPILAKKRDSYVPNLTEIMMGGYGEKIIIKDNPDTRELIEKLKSTPVAKERTDMGDLYSYYCKIDTSIFFV